MTETEQNPLSRWQRLLYDKTPIFVAPEKPDWFVPGPTADALLRNPLGNSGHPLSLELLALQTACGETHPYLGRSSHLSLNGLKECWFHLTNRCNLACKHCLFSSSPKREESIDPDLLAKGIQEAREMGSPLFYFTGGEPFVYPGFPELVKELLTDPETHVVILTNGLLLEENIELIARLDTERLHLQISLDGLADHHDLLRGKGTYKRLMSALETLAARDVPATLSVAVNRINYKDLPAITELAAGKNISNLHFLWHFVRGNGCPEQFVDPAKIFPELVKAHQIAEKNAVIIDNIENIRSQVFSSPGTRFDMSNAGWESLAIGPDGNIYPSPAMVGLPEIVCGNLASGLKNVWQESPVFKAVRKATVLDSSADRPLRFITGGDDIDHSYMRGGKFTGHDPYLPLYESIALWLIATRSEKYPIRNPGEIRLRMGDVRHDCPDGGQDVSLTHCNCVISLAGDHGHHSVREFYARAAETTNKEIVNPFIPARSGLDFIPSASRNRSYGCGSPVHDAQPKPGETLVDLGSGSGVECFLASAAVGREGRVFGIDMTREMLDLAEKSKLSVIEELGYDNLQFTYGFLEDIPLPDCEADVVISNCVINLSPDKRGTLHEIFRILKPGGRLVVSDIVTDHSVPVQIKNNEQFRGECLGGALQQIHLLAMLRAAGFQATQLLKRFPYRMVGDTRFYSLTFSCHKPAATRKCEVIYRGPLEGVCLPGGVFLAKGVKATVEIESTIGLGDEFFVIDSQGRTANSSAQDSCCGLSGGGLAFSLPAFSENQDSTDNCCGQVGKGK
ncbi:MAG: methyltransferase domain-containing protein [Proteobacteria bacterium]|nr:methyltransferase domain-containing protein [Pseudomonadota bacterium]MBU1737547.1 methyltransferase domain-containing protein [Pseudomonadota bacterium]